MKEELLDLVSLPKTTTGQDISDALIEVLKKHHVPLDKISSIARWSRINGWKKQRSNCISKENQPIV